MQHFRRLGRVSLLALSMLSSCAAADPPSGNGAHADRYAPSGVFGSFLAGRFAVAASDPNRAAHEFLRALAASPGDQELLQQAFIASVLSGRSESIQLARQLPDNQVAQLLLGDEAARTGHWQEAELRFSSLPRRGVTQLLEPVLIAWAQQGGGHTDAALATLRPFIEGQRFRGVFALHAAMIADLSGRTGDAAKLYADAATEMPEMNLRLAQILASWQTRTGHPEQARRTLASLADAAPDIAIATPALLAAARQRPVASATEGIAEAYLALASALRSQEAGNFAIVMLRLALDLHPDFTPARLLASDMLAIQHHPEAAMQMLAALPASDPLSPVIRLRRAALADRLGQTDDAMQALERLAADYPASPTPWIQQGDILRSQQRFGAAATAYSRGIARIHQPDHADWAVYYSRGIAYERIHQWPEAEADFHFALKLAPDQPAVLNYLGYSWADMGHRLPEARQMIETAVSRRPNDGAITDSLGWVMLRQGETESAVRTLERAVELEPEDATINGHLGDAYWAAGRKLEAEFQWRRALTLNPSPDDVVKLEAKLQTTPKPAAVISGQ